MVVPGVDVGKLAGPCVEDPEERRDELVDGRILIDDVVDPAGELRQRKVDPRQRAQGRLDIRHQQRCGGALARDVGDRHEHPSGAEVDDVVAVAADLLRRDRTGRDLVAVDRRQRLRQ